MVREPSDVNMTPNEGEREGRKGGREDVLDSSKSKFEVTRRVQQDH